MARGMRRGGRGFSIPSRYLPDEERETLGGDDAYVGLDIQRAGRRPDWPSFSAWDPNKETWAEFRKRTKGGPK